MSQFRTLYVGRDGHKDTIAVASVAKEHDAEVVARGPLGTRQCDLAPLMRTLQAQAQPLVFVYAAGPGGYGLDRSLTHKADGCWVVAPSLMPTRAGDRGKPARREARHLARLMRSGDLPPVSVPAVAEAARRDLRRAREETRRALQAAKPSCCGPLAAIQGEPTGAPPPCAGAARGSVPPPRNPWSCRKTSRRLRPRRNVGGVVHAHATHRGTPGAYLLAARRSRPCAGARARWR